MNLYNAFQSEILWLHYEEFSVILFTNCFLYILFLHFWYSYYENINKSLTSISLLDCIHSLTHSFQFFFKFQLIYFWQPISLTDSCFLFSNILPYISKNIYIRVLNNCFLCSISSMVSSIRYFIYYPPEYLHSSEGAKIFIVNSSLFTWDS